MAKAQLPGPAKPKRSIVEKIRTAWRIFLAICALGVLAGIVSFGAFVVYPAIAKFLPREHSPAMVNPTSTIPTAAPGLVPETGAERKRRFPEGGDIVALTERNTSGGVFNYNIERSPEQLKAMGIESGQFKVTMTTTSTIKIGYSDKTLLFTDLGNGRIKVRFLDARINSLEIAPINPNTDFSIDPLDNSGQAPAYEFELWLINQVMEHSGKVEDAKTDMIYSARDEVRIKICMNKARLWSEAYYKARSDVETDLAARGYEPGDIDWVVPEHLEPTGPDSPMCADSLTRQLGQ